MRHTHNSHISLFVIFLLLSAAQTTVLYPQSCMAVICISYTVFCVACRFSVQYSVTVYWLQSTVQLLARGRRTAGFHSNLHPRKTYLTDLRDAASEAPAPHSFGSLATRSARSASCSHWSGSGVNVIPLSSPSMTDPGFMSLSELASRVGRVARNASFRHTLLTQRPA